MRQNLGPRQAYAIAACSEHARKTNDLPNLTGSDLKIFLQGPSRFNDTVARCEVATSHSFRHQQSTISVQSPVNFTIYCFSVGGGGKGILLVPDNFFVLGVAY